MTADDGGFFLSLWYVRPLGTHALMFHDPSTALFHRAVHISHPVRHRSHVDLPVWKAKENSKLKLLKQMTTTKKSFRPWNGALTPSDLFGGSYVTLITFAYQSKVLIHSVIYQRRCIMQENSPLWHSSLFIPAHVLLSLQDHLDVYMENIRVGFDVCGKYWKGKRWSKQVKWCWGHFLLHAVFWIFLNMTYMNILLYLDKN